MNIIFFIGRIIYGGFFLYNAYKHLLKTDQLAGYAVSKGVPFARQAVILSGVLILFGGYTVIAGVRTTWGLIAIVLFLLPVTYQMHAFWNEADPNARAMQLVQFTKNMALLGAALMLMMVPTPWPFSL